MNRFFRGLLRFRFVVLLLLGAITAWLGSYVIPMESLRFDFSFKRLFLSYGGDPDVLREFHNDFGDDVGLISVLFVMPEQEKKPPPEKVTGTVFEPGMLRPLISLSTALKKTREISPEHVMGLPQLSLLHAPTVIPELMPERLRALDEAVSKHQGWTASKAIHAVEGHGDHPPPPEDVVKAVRRYQAAKASLMRHRLYVGQLISEDARVTRVVAKFSLDYAHDHQRTPVVRALTSASKLSPEERSRLKDITLDDVLAKMPAGTQAYVSGVPTIQQAYSDLTMDDMSTFVPFISLAMTLLLFFLFRAVHATILPMIGVGLATVWSIGFLQMQGEAITLMTSVIPVLVLVIGVADSIHIIARYHQEAPKATNRETAIVETMVHMAPPCLLAALTTGTGFASLLAANIPSVRAFGLYAAYSIVFAFLIQMTLIPIGLSLVKKPTKTHQTRSTKGPFTWGLEWISQAVTLRPRRVLGVSGLLLLLAGVGISQLSDEVKVLAELQDDHPVSQALLKTEAHLSGVLVHAVTFKGKVYSDELCATDIDCERKDCKAESCAYPDCCRTRICRRVDRSHLLVENLRINASSLMDEDSNPAVKLLSQRVNRMKSVAFNRPSDDGDDDDELIEEEEDEAPGGDAPAPALATAVPKSGVCVESVKNRPFVSAVAALDDWLEGSEKHSAMVSRVVSLADLMREMNLALAGWEDLKNYTIPKDLDRKMFANAFRSLESAPGDTLTRTVTRNYDRTNVSIMANDAGSTAWTRLESDLRAKLKELFTDNPEIGDKFSYAITGSSTHAQGALQSIVRDIGSSIGLAFIFIWILISVLFRSPIIGLASMVPNILPLFLTLAIMGFAGISLRVSSVIIFSISLGIAVDDTIHFLARLREEARVQTDVDGIINATMHGTGRAVVLTTIILCMGLAVNGLSAFVAMQQFGLLSACTLIMALLGVLFLLPALVKRFRLDTKLR